MISVSVSFCFELFNLVADFCVFLQIWSVDYIVGRLQISVLKLSHEEKIIVIELSY